MPSQSRRPNRRRRGRRIVIATKAVAIGLVLAATGCTASHPDRMPVGERFPDVAGRSLAGIVTPLPESLTGEPTLLLVGYVQDAQFDLDRWALGLAMAKSPLRRLEVPAVGGWFPDLALQPTIDDGMRAGIPERDWPAVVTLYGDDAERVRRFTGTGHPRNARVVLLDADGVVRWFHAAGYSPTDLLELLEVADEPTSGSTDSTPSS